MSCNVISVGAGKNQLPLIKAMVERGYKVIAFDRDSNAPGAQFATLFNNISTWSYNEAIRWLKETGLKYHGVGCLSCFRAVLTQHKIASYFDLPFVIDADLVELSHNKYEFRKKLMEHGLTSLQEFKNPNELAKYLRLNNMKKRFVIKPINGICSVGIVEVSGADLVTMVGNHQIDFNKVFVQEHLFGKEYRIMCLCQNGNIKVLKAIKKENLEGTFFTARFYPIHSDTRIEQLIWKIIQGFKLNDAIFTIDCIVNKNTIEILELDFESPGDYFETYLAPYFFNYNFMDSYVQLILGDEVIYNEAHSKTYSCADYLYNLSDRPLKIDYSKLQLVLRQLFGDYLLVHTKDNGQTVYYPSSNMDNFGMVIHQRDDISNIEINRVINENMVHI